MAAYRPITLLNADYRLLARVFADRLQPALETVISASQTGFIRGRRGGENILLLQVLPHALPPDSPAVAVLCDFAKAYDTCDRGFLFEAMEGMGVAPAFLAWARLLHADTRARAAP